MPSGLPFKNIQVGGCECIHGAVPPSPPITFQNIFITSSISVSKYFPLSPLPRPWQPLIYILSRWTFLFWTFHINGVISYVPFYDWLLSLSLMFLRFIHVVAWNRTPFLVVDEFYAIIRLYHSLFIHSPVDGHLDCFYFFLLLWIMLLWTFIYKFGVDVSFLSGIYLSGGIAALWDNPV